jgi:hypothetical protein
MSNIISYQISDLIRFFLVYLKITRNEMNVLRCRTSVGKVHTKKKKKKKKKNADVFILLIDIVDRWLN